MTEEAHKTAKAMHQNECEDCVFNPTKLGCRWRKKGMYCDTDLHSAADLIESLSAQLEQVEMERDGLNIMLAQAQAMLETRTKERDAAVKQLGEVALCQDCAHYKHNGGDCSGELFCMSHETGFKWQWRGVEVEHGI